MATLAESAEVNLVSVFDAFPHPEQGAIGAGRNPLEREACGLGRIEQPFGCDQIRAISHGNTWPVAGRVGPHWRDPLSLDSPVKLRRERCRIGVDAL
jgi:hypothetical protein